jgi:glycerate dehydrogenase
MRIVVLDGYTANPGDLSWEGLEALGELTVYDRTPPSLTAERIRGAEIVFTNKTRLDRAHIEGAECLRFIGVLATGFDIADGCAARERGITVCNVPAYSSNSVAQMAVGFLLEMATHIGEHSRAVHGGQWFKSPDYCFWNFPLFELAGKTLGILGFGNIGSRVAAIAHALGMEIIAFRRRAVPGSSEDFVRFVTLDELFSGCDFLSVHCPLNESSKGILNAANISKMRDGAAVVNTSRGGCAVSADVAAALRSGKLSWYSADVAAAEPISADDPLLGLPNAILTPHIAWATKEARARLIEISVSNLRAFLDGKPQNVVN